MQSATPAFNKALVAKLSEHFAEFQREANSTWQRIALELSSDSNSEPQRYQDLKAYFERSLVYKLKYYSNDQDFVDRMQYRYLRRVYRVVVELVDKPPKVETNMTLVEENKLFLKSLINGCYDPAVVAAFKRRAKTHLCINVGDPVYNLTPSQRELLMKIEQNRTRNRKGTAAQRQLEPGTWHDAATGSAVILDGVPVTIEQASSPAKGERSHRRLLDEESLNINTQEYDQIIKDSLEPELPPLPPRKRLLSIASTVDSEDEDLEVSSTDTSVNACETAIPDEAFIVINPDEILTASSINTTTTPQHDPLQLSMRQSQMAPETQPAADHGEKDSTTSEPLFTPSSGESAKTTEQLAPVPSGIFRAEDLIAMSQPPTLILEEDAAKQPTVVVKVEPTESLQNIEVGDRGTDPPSSESTSAVPNGSTNCQVANSSVSVQMTSSGVQTDEPAEQPVGTGNHRTVATQTSATEVEPVEVVKTSDSAVLLVNSTKTIELTADGLVAGSFFREDSDDDDDEEEDDDDDDDDEEEDESEDVEKSAELTAEIQPIAAEKEVSPTKDPPKEAEMDVEAKAPETSATTVVKAEVPEVASESVISQDGALKSSPSAVNSTRTVELTADGLVAASFFWEDSDDEDDEEENEEEDDDDDDEEDVEKAAEPTIEVQLTAVKKEVSPSKNPPKEAEMDVEVEVPEEPPSSSSDVQNRLEAEPEHASNDVDQIPPPTAVHEDMNNNSQPVDPNVKEPLPTASTVTTTVDLPLPPAPTTGPSHISRPQTPAPDSSKESSADNAELQRRSDSSGEADVDVARPGGNDGHEPVTVAATETVSATVATDKSNQPAEPHVDPKVVLANPEEIVGNSPLVSKSSPNRTPLTSDGFVARDFFWEEGDDEDDEAVEEEEPTVEVQPTATASNEPNSDEVTLPTPPPSSRSSTPPTVESMNPLRRRLPVHRAVLEPFIRTHLALYESLRHRWPQLFQPATTTPEQIFCDLNNLNDALTDALFSTLRPSDPFRVVQLRSMVDALAIRIAFGTTLQELRGANESQPARQAAEPDQSRGWEIVVESALESVVEEAGTPQPASKRIRIGSNGGGGSGNVSMITITLSDSEDSPSLVLPVRKKRKYRIRQT